MKGKVDKEVTWFEISSTFNSFGGMQGVKNGGQNHSKRLKTSLSLNEYKYKCYFRLWITLGVEET